MFANLQIYTSTIKRKIIAKIFVDCNYSLFICSVIKCKKMKATIKDIKEADRIVTESMKAKRGKGSYSERMEDMMLTYENVTMIGSDCIIRLQNGTYQSIWTYV